SSRPASFGAGRPRAPARPSPWPGRDGDAVPGDAVLVDAVLVDAIPVPPYLPGPRPGRLAPAPSAVPRASGVEAEAPAELGGGGLDQVVEVVQFGGGGFAVEGDVDGEVVVLDLDVEAGEE